MFSVIIIKPGFSSNNDQLASMSLFINPSGSTLQYYLVWSLSVEVLCASRGCVYAHKKVLKIWISAVVRDHVFAVLGKSYSHFPYTYSVMCTKPNHKTNIWRRHALGSSRTSATQTLYIPRAVFLDLHWSTVQRERTTTKLLGFKSESYISSNTGWGAVCWLAYWSLGIVMKPCC